MLFTFAERVVNHAELVLEVSIPEYVNLLIGRHVRHDQLQMVHAQSTNAHKHSKGIEQKEDKQPGERCAEPVAHRGVQEEQVGDGVPHQDGHKVLVVITPHGVVDERAGKEKNQGE